MDASYILEADSRQLIRSMVSPIDNPCLASCSSSPIASGDQENLWRVAEEAADTSGAAEDLADEAVSDSATISTISEDSPPPACARHLRRCAP